MNARSAGRVRRALSTGPVRALLVVVALIVAAAIVVPHLPRPIAGVATLDQCSGGWAAVGFAEEDWNALPDSVRTYLGRRQVPIAEWPRGMRFDENAGVLVDRGGDAVFRKGDRVRVSGTVVETDGDPAPCFFLRGLKVESITIP